MAVMRPELIMKSIIPVVMAGIIAIYGLVVSVLIAGSLEEPESGYTLYKYTRSTLSFLAFNNSFLNTQRVHSFGSWIVSRICGTSSRLCDWNRWGLRSPWNCSAASAFCRHDLDSYFR